MLRSLFALTVIAVFAFYAIGSVYAAMLMYWWFGLFRPQEWMWWDTSSLRLPLLAAALFVVPAFLKGYYPRPGKHPIGLLIVAFLVSVLISTVDACVSDQPVDTKHIATLILVTLISERLLNSTKDIWGLLLVATASLAYLNSHDAIDAVLGGHSLYGLLINRGSFSDGNGAAMGGAISVFLQLFVIHTIGSGDTANTPKLLSNRPVRLATKAALYFLLLGTVLFIFKTESRGAALSLLIGLAIWTMLQPRKLRILSTLGVLVAIVLVVGVPQSYKDRINSAFVDESELDDSAASRPHFWGIAKRMAQTHAFGVGIGCYKENYDNYDHTGGYYGYRRSVHSSHYSIMAETGYPGFTVWVLLNLVTYVTLFKVRSRAGARRRTDPEQDFYFRLSNAIIASMTIFIIGGNFYEIAYNDYTWLMFAIAIATARLHRTAPAAAPPDRKSPASRTRATVSNRP